MPAVNVTPTRVLAGALFVVVFLITFSIETQRQNRPPPPYLRRLSPAAFVRETQELPPPPPPPSPPPPPPPSPPPHVVDDPLATDEPIGQPHTEYWGDVVVPGSGRGGVNVDTARQCQRKCDETRGCNVWVFCPAPNDCARQCWLKWTPDPHNPVVHGEGAAVAWTSGAILKDYDDGTPRPPADESVTHVLLTTNFGSIRVQLMPEWSLSSVQYVREVADQGLCTPNCVFYRAEPGFLLQGGMRASIPPNNRTTPGPIMAKGFIGWAGGSAGPDFFIYMSDNLAVGWHNDHTCWGMVTEERSLDMIEEMLAVPTEQETPQSMHMIVDPIPFTLKAERT